MENNSINVLRIVHLSDIHLSGANLTDLRNHYIEALCKDFELFHKEKAIDIIIISGDLVDKGGNSLGYKPYEEFEREFITPLIEKLDLKKEQFLIVPGNHDVNRELIDEEREYFLTGRLTSENTNSKLEEFRVDFDKSNERIKKFKMFEKSLHEGNPNYTYSNNESTMIVEINQQKVGIALINDSWRCSTELQQANHFFGTNQLFASLNLLKSNDTKLNIAVFHHPLDAFNEEERENANNILKSQNFDVVICGHSHSYQAETLYSTSGGYLLLNGRSAFNNPSEKISKYQPGYNLLDLDIGNGTFTLKARKYISNRYSFDVDSDSLKDGIFSGHLPSNSPYIFPLGANSNNQDKSLPSSYQADVEKIVQLLIGKSLYSDKYVFLRELIQNSVDACHRTIEKGINATPKITVVINSKERYVEISDDGDGMSKDILKSHFSIVGKSISQQFNEHAGYSNLISQFGVGFISTFIVAEKIVIHTKTPEDGSISFEINNVFSGFQYFVTSDDKIVKPSGTIIRVYLKAEFTPEEVLNKVRNYCRNIDNLEVYFNSSLVHLPFSWTPPNPDGLYENETDRYKVKLGIFKNPVPLTASNCGFLITHYPYQIIPYKFPSIIGGEINFKPKGIDLDLSRSNIIASNKSDSVRKEISISLRRLFRMALEDKSAELRALIVNYLFHYLVTYDSDVHQMAISYSDFYSKAEILELIKNNAVFVYKNNVEKLSDIFLEMNRLNLDIIYFISKVTRTDYEEVIISHLSNKGYLIIQNLNTSAQFRDLPLNVSLKTVFQVIASNSNLHILDIESISSLDNLPDIKLDKSSFSSSVQRLIKEIETTHGINVEIGKFGVQGKQYVNNDKIYFLNSEHNSVKSLFEKAELQDTNISKVYLTGLIGLSLIT